MLLIRISDIRDVASAATASELCTIYIILCISLTAALSYCGLSYSSLISKSITVGELRALFISDKIF
nr:MAG TPA: hypothetical protein [Caudoviricetes sp.]